MDSLKAGSDQVAGVPPIPFAEWLASVHYDRVDIAYDYLCYIIDRVKAGKGISQIGCMFQDGVSLMVLHYQITDEDRVNREVFTNAEEVWIAIRMDSVLGRS